MSSKNPAQKVLSKNKGGISLCTWKSWNTAGQRHGWICSLQKCLQDIVFLSALLSKFLYFQALRMLLQHELAPCIHPINITNFYRLTCVPPKFICWGFNPHATVFRDRALWRQLRSNAVIRVGTSPNEIGVPLRTDTRNCSLSYRQTKIRQPPTSQEKASPETDYTDTLILDFSASKTVRNKLLLFKNLVCDILSWQPSWLIHNP